MNRPINANPSGNNWMGALALALVLLFAVGTLVSAGVRRYQRAREFEVRLVRDPVDSACMEFIKVHKPTGFVVDRWYEQNPKAYLGAPCTGYGVR
ncbi:MAG: hypothetical protein KY468_06460 [Armatimonadetes bacterium]|nr:hypothetical protein [Armatimonadota bacterium]